MLSPLTLLAQTCPIDGEVMLYSGVTTGERGTLNIYTCSNGHNSYVNISGSGGTTSGSSGSSSSGSSSSNSADVMKNAAIQGYNLARYGNVNGRASSKSNRTNTTNNYRRKKGYVSEEEYYDLLYKYNALKKQYENLVNYRDKNFGDCNGDGTVLPEEKFNGKGCDCDGNGFVSYKEATKGCN